MKQSVSTPLVVVIVVLVVGVLGYAIFYKSGHPYGSGDAPKPPMTLQRSNTPMAAPGGVPSQKMGMQGGLQAAPGMPGNAGGSGAMAPPPAAGGGMMAPPPPGGGSTSNTPP